MNVTTSKFATWVVRISEPHLVNYTFVAKGEKIEAQKFMCYLIGTEPHQYASGCVNFAFSNRNAAQDAFAKFKAGTCWFIKKPSFDTRTKPEYVGAPLKSVVLLTFPTETLAINPVQLSELHEHTPVTYISPALRLGDVLNLKNAKSQIASRSIDFSAKVLTIGPIKNVTVKGTQTQVRDVDLQDDSGFKCTLSVWGDACVSFNNEALCNTGVTILQCSSVRDQNGVKMNLHSPGGRILQGGIRNEELTQLPAAGGDLGATSVTATFEPTYRPIDASGSALHTSVAVLANHIKVNRPNETDVIVQVNRVMMQASTDPDRIVTHQGNRLLVPVMVRDRTGAVEMEVLEVAAPIIYTKNTPEEVHQAMNENTLTVASGRFNLRGCVRCENNVTKIYVVELWPHDNKSDFSTSAAQMLRGLVDIQGDVVAPAPLCKVTNSALLGLTIARDNDERVGANQVIAVVQGTSSTTLTKLGEEAYSAISSNVKCLMSPESEGFTCMLRGYCGWEDMLQYRLDEEQAIVYITAAATTSDGVTFTVGYMKKIKPHEKDEILANFMKEANTILLAEAPPPLTETPTRLLSPGSGRKCRKIQREPTSPTA